jgi:predicted Zn-dependent protease
MAQIVLGNNDPENAKKYMRKAIKLQPENYGPYYDGRYIFSAAILDSAAYHYEIAVKIDPDRKDLQVALANLYTETGKSQKAREVLESIDENYGLNESTAISLIRNLISERKFSEAEKKVKELLLVEPDNIIYNGLQADIYQSEGKKEDALDVYTNLILRNPDNPVIQMKLCNFLLEEKEYEELFSVLNTFILNNRISKEEKIVFFGSMVEDTVILNRYSEDMKMSLMILEATYVNDDIIVLLRPDFLVKLNKLNEAAVRLEEIIRVNPDNYHAWEKLLLTYYEEKNFERLQERGREASARFNRSILAKILYAHAAMENMDYNTALDELKKAEISWRR